jgi:hypothetical protein
MKMEYKSGAAGTVVSSLSSSRSHRSGWPQRDILSAYSFPEQISECAFNNLF